MSRDKDGFQSIASGMGIRGRIRDELGEIAAEAQCARRAEMRKAKDAGYDKPSFGGRAQDADENLL